MKKVLLLIIAQALFIVIAQAQVKTSVPKNFNVFTTTNVDSAVIILNKLIVQQYKGHATKFKEVTKECIVKRYRGMSFYFETMTKIKVVDRKVFAISFHCSTGNNETLVFKDKKMTEEAYSALICLINNAQKNN